MNKRSNNKLDPNKIPRNIIYDMAFLRGQEIKTPGQFYNAVQSQRMQSVSGKKLDIILHNPEVKDKYTPIFADKKCNSC